jgi:hypothetical protein
VQLPRFATWSEISSDKLEAMKVPKSFLAAELNETTSSIGNWLQSAFLVNLSKTVYKDALRVGFVSIVGGRKSRQDGQVLVIDAVSSGRTTRVQVQCDSMEVCADVVQDLAKYCKIDDLDTAADFPKEYKRFEAVLATVEDANASRVRLAADMADDSQRVKVVLMLLKLPHLTYCVLLTSRRWWCGPRTRASWPTWTLCAGPTRSCSP